MKTRLTRKFSKQLIVLLALTFSLQAKAITVVSPETNVAPSYSPGTYSISSAPSIQNITTATNFVNSFFGAPSTIGQAVPNPVSTLNGIDYEVWMSGPVLSRYYNTNIYTASRNSYGINSTLPLLNQTAIVDYYGQALN